MTTHVLLDGEQGRLILKRLRPWHQIVARSQAARLDRELAEGASPEASASLAARAARLTSTEFRRDLAASLRRILVAAGEPALPAGEPTLAAAAPPVAAPPLGAARPVRVPLSTSRISKSATRLAELASHLLQPGPVPVRGVALVSQLLADGTGPLYREASRDDLGGLIERAERALAL